jgi:hypothetical protein
MGKNVLLRGISSSFKDGVISGLKNREFHSDFKNLNVP